MAELDAEEKRPILYVTAPAWSSHPYRYAVKITVKDTPPLLVDCDSTGMS
jgi:hypothetical protein